MRDVVTAAQRLDALKALGIRIGVDDFGEGHSSLAYLASLPLDLLKIPKTFVDPLGAPEANLALVRAIVELARSFGLHTVAEGIEERDQLAPLIGARLRAGAGLPVREARERRRGGGARGSRRRQPVSRSRCASGSDSSFLSVWFSIWRMRSRVTLNARPTSSSVNGRAPVRPKRISITSRSR